MLRRIFTFGSGHHCKCGAPLHNYYAVIEADDPRAEMHKAWGDKWAGEYNSEALAGVATYRLQPLKSFWQCNDH